MSEHNGLTVITGVDRISRAVKRDACYDKRGAVESTTHWGALMRTKAIDRRQFMSRRTGAMLAARRAILVASTFWILMAAPLALYPGAQLDQEFERDHLRNPKSEQKQYFTSDSFDKVTAYYKKLAPEAAGSTINTKTRRRMAFRDKGDEKNSTTVEWSNEAGEDQSKTFILVDTAK